MELSIGSSLTISHCSVDGERVGSCEEPATEGLAVLNICNVIEPRVIFFSLDIIKVPHQFN